MTNKEAIEILKKCKEESEEDYYVKRAEALEKGIEALENQKTGHWINRESDFNATVYHYCSVCNSKTPTGASKYDFYDYCPHCGAKMKGE